MTHPHSERWSDYIDGALSPAEAGELDTHLAACGECRALFEGLRRVVARAGTLEDQPPRTDLWPRVSSRIGLGRRRFAFSMPELLAAGVALMLISGGGVAYLLRDRLAGATISTRQQPGPVLRTVAAGEGYDVAIGRLRLELAKGRGSLDSTTMRVIEEKLALIDQAILDAERAVTADPGSEYLQAHLTRSRLTKLDLLRRATHLTRTIS
jgi:hypothetical protein